MPVFRWCYFWFQIIGVHVGDDCNTNDSDGVLQLDGVLDGFDVDNNGWYIICWPTEGLCVVDLVACAVGWFVGDSIGDIVGLHWIQTHNHPYPLC